MVESHWHSVRVLAGGTIVRELTATLIGMASVTSGIVQWRRTGNRDTLYAPADILGASSGSAFDMTGLPGEIRVANTQHVLCARSVNGRHHSAERGRYKMTVTVLVQVARALGTDGWSILQSAERKAFK